MIKLFFDIETLPCAEDKKGLFLEILRNKNGNGKYSDEELYLKTSFEGTFGRICCIGVIKEVDGVITFAEVFRGSEKEILKKFWEVSSNVELFIGHNILEFDLPFIYKRSIILGVKPRVINMAKYRSDTVFDTQCEWEKWAWGKAQKLDTLAKVLYLPTSKGEMDGSKVWLAYQEGRIEDICSYCMKDVELTRQVYYKMLVQEVNPDSAEEVDDLNF